MAGRGGLFTAFFLEAGLPQTPEWAQYDDATMAAWRDGLLPHWNKLAALNRPNEAQTEQAFIRPVFAALDWPWIEQQKTGRRRTDVPDALVFPTAATLEQARPLEAAERFALAVAVVENESRDKPLDRASAGTEAPSSQLLRYLIAAETVSGGAVRWGVLTTGRIWRLYWSGARSRTEGYVEFDLAALLADGDLAGLRAFRLLFRREAFLAEGTDGTTFLQRALDEGRRYESRVTAELAEAVFDRGFPLLLRALAAGDPHAAPDDPSWRAALREAALTLLYRLLFVLYAEDRALLPVGTAGYDEYSLRRIRQQAAETIDRGEAISARATIWWGRLQNLFAAIAGGDNALALPPYNGGLFDGGRQPLLERAKLTDRDVATLVDELSRETFEGVRRSINYRDLSVQHLGSIYERLLEYDVRAEDGELVIRLNTFARKNSGSYYTPEELVRLIIARSVGPLVDERRNRFAARAAELAGDRRPKADRLALLHPLDPASALLDLKVLDPAMGSGHFLVSLVDVLTDAVLESLAAAPVQVEWAEYRSPLAERIIAIRAHIEGEAKRHGWQVREEHLDDRHIVRRMVLKRVVYGVDLNPMAVELAKLSLWLHSFTVGAPLSFLDHHLRCGDSLFGEFVRGSQDWLQKHGGLFLNETVVSALGATDGMLLVEQLTDADIAEVKRSAETFAGVAEATAPLERLLDLVQAIRWLAPLGNGEDSAFSYLLDGVFGDPVAILTGAAKPAGKAPAGDRKNMERLLEKVRTLAAERRFLHWEAAFPGLWRDWSSVTPPGGFDALIGNPPWDRIKLQEVEWFAARLPEGDIAQQTRAADRKRKVAALKKAGGPLAQDFERAVWTAEGAARVARSSGHYPLLSGGDPNLYALFVERALRLVKADGVVALLVPSGIAADKSASAFFRSVSTTGRLAAFF